jgi:hypothetical protein
MICVGLRPEAAMDDASPLAYLLQSQHLSDSATRSYHDAFEQTPSRFVVIEDFLVPDIAARLSEFLRSEAEFAREYGLYSAEDEPVEEAEWEAADEQDRFFRFGKLVGTPPQFAFSDNSLTYLRFRTAFQSDDNLRLFFEAVTGLELAASDDFGSHSMRAGDFLKPHDDNNRNRRLALVLYLSPSWKPEHGGALHIVDQDGSESVIQATYNSLVAFDTRANTVHYVEPIRDAAGEESRLTIGGWYHGD